MPVDWVAIFDLYFFVFRISSFLSFYVPGCGSDVDVIAMLCTRFTRVQGCESDFFPRKRMVFFHFCPVFFPANFFPRKKMEKK